MQHFVFRLLGEINTFKKVALFLLTGLTCLCLLFGYRLIQNDSIYDLWKQDPKIIKVSYPCYTQQLRDDLFIIAIDFPVPDDVSEVVSQNTTAYRLRSNPDMKSFYKLCRSLQDTILDEEAEQWLTPLKQKAQQRQGL